MFEGANKRWAVLELGASQEAGGHSLNVTLQLPLAQSVEVSGSYELGSSPVLGDATMTWNDGDTTYVPGSGQVTLTRLRGGKLRGQLAAVLVRANAESERVELTGDFEGLIELNCFREAAQRPEINGRASGPTAWSEVSLADPACRALVGG